MDLWSPCGVHVESVGEGKVQPLFSIEQVFHTIKAWLRRHEAQATSPKVQPWLIHQATEIITEEMAISWIKNCGYSFEIADL